MVKETFGGYVLHAELVLEYGGEVRRGKAHPQSMVVNACNVVNSYP